MTLVYYPGPSLSHCGGIGLPSLNTRATDCTWSGHGSRLCSPTTAGQYFLDITNITACFVYLVAVALNKRCMHHTHWQRIYFLTIIQFAAILQAGEQFPIQLQAASSYRLPANGKDVHFICPVSIHCPISPNPIPRTQNQHANFQRQRSRDPPILL
jgi:hypothetical protein